MKIVQMVIFLMILSASFSILGSTGIFFCSDEIDTSFWRTDLFTTFIIDFFGTAIATGIGLAYFGMNPFTTAAFSAMFFGFITSLKSAMFIVWTIGGLAKDADFLIIGPSGIFFVIVAIQGFLAVYTLIQMATGGGKGFE